MKITKLALSLLMVFSFALAVQADEEKGEKKTLKGSLVCGRCTLKITSGCSNVLEVVKGDKKTHYIIDDKAKAEKYHKAICPPNSESKNVTVTGLVYKKGDHWHIKDATVKVGKKG